VVGVRVGVTARKIIVVKIGKEINRERMLTCIQGSRLTVENSKKEGAPERHPYLHPDYLRVVSPQMRV